jgi:hypothetical protein
MANVPAAEHATVQCTHIKKDGERCKRYSIKGGTVCTTPGHGGTLPRVRTAAQFRIARDKKQQEALERLKAQGASRVEVIEELDRLAAEAIVWKDLCREAMEELWHLGQIRYEGQTGEQLRAEIALFERMLDRCFNVLAGMVKLNIAEKKVELDKQKAILVAMAIREILRRLDLTIEQQRRAPQIIKEEMLALSAEVS